jgi:hypothetical protein
MVDPSPLTGSRTTGGNLHDVSLWEFVDELISCIAWVPVRADDVSNQRMDHMII